MEYAGEINNFMKNGRKTAACIIATPAADRSYRSWNLRGVADRDWKKIIIYYTYGLHHFTIDIDFIIVYQSKKKEENQSRFIKIVFHNKL